MVGKIKVGDKAPNFCLPDIENRPRNLKEFLGQKVILVFSVAAFTSTCTKEKCEFRDSISQLINLKAQVAGIDVNVPFINKALAKQRRLNFPILSDYNREVIKLFGLEEPDSSDAQGELRPSIFVLDERGIILYMWLSNDQMLEPNFDEIKKVLSNGRSEDKALKVNRTVITISRQTGSGGDEVAQKLSKILGYSYFDKNLLVSEAKSIGVPEQEIADFPEHDYQVKSVVDKILLRKRPVAISLASKDNAIVSKALDEEACLSVIRTVINSLASKGKTVIVGRGGQAILKNIANVLHVRIVAPTAVRVKNIMKNRGLNKEEALKLIEDTDKAEAEYLQRFYNVDWKDPAIYDMVLNMSKMNLNSAAKLIASVASPASKPRSLSTKIKKA
jgi:peroxiredoxin/cytidylate kinase